METLESILEDFYIILLTLVVVIFGNGNYVNIIIAGLLMVYITYNFICEDRVLFLDIIALILCLIYAYIGVFFIGFLGFYFAKITKIKYRVLVGIVLYCIITMVFNPINPARMVFNAMILGLIYLLLWGVHILIKRNKQIRKQEIRRIEETNVREIYERQINEKLIRQNAIIEKNARLMERENISRNIHNSVGHSITAAVMTLEAADMLYDVKPDEARVKMNSANERIKGSLESIRRAIRVMDASGGDISSEDLKAQMEEIIDAFVMDTTIKVHKDFTTFADGININNEHGLFITGVLEELLTNGVKHGNANEFIVSLSGNSAYIKLEVSDNGKSDFNEDNKDKKIEEGYGLKKIISYVEKYGGNTEFSYDNGFKAAVELYI